MAALALTLNVAVAQKVDTPADTGSAVQRTNSPGTRRQDRTVAESSAPIDVLTGKELANYPSASMLDTLSNLVPSFVVGQNPISDASSFVRSTTLRGLPSDEMLVMLNGKRMNRSALVQVYQGGETELAFGSQGPDLNSIPSVAVKSLEILRDGASAQYGSDAIAGVLNYQFRNNPSGIEIDGRYGEYFPTGFGTRRRVAGGECGVAVGQRGIRQLKRRMGQERTDHSQPDPPLGLGFRADLSRSRAAIAELSGSRTAVGHAALRQRQDLLEFRHQARQRRSGLLLRQLRQYSNERELQLPLAEDRHRLRLDLAADLRVLVHRQHAG